MISSYDYFVKPHTAVHEASALDLLARRERLREEFRRETGLGIDIDPDTGTEISGRAGGDGDGGFRTPSAAGAANSSHKQALAVDDSDQLDAFDNWLSKYDREDGRFNEKLEKYGLYREHPSVTPTWCHLTTRAPGSGKRTFYP